MIRACLASLVFTTSAMAEDVRIGTSPDFPPYIDKTADGLQGLDHDLMSEICNAASLNCIWSEMPFKDLVAAIAEGRIEIAIGGMSATSDRAAIVDFSTPYVDNTNEGMVLSRPNPTRSLENGTVAVQIGTTYEAFAHASDWTVVAFENANDAIRAVADGDVDYVFSSPGSLRAVIERGNTSLVIARTIAFPSAPTAIAVSKERTDLKAILDENLDRMKTSGLLEKLRRKWFSTSL